MRNQDRDCNSCINHTEKGCRKWDCEYEKLMSIQDAILALRMVEAHGIADKAKETAIRSLEAWKKVEEEIDTYLWTEGFGSAYRNEIRNIINKALGEVGESE